jgi:DNA-binding MarR family transcriptional regulator
MLEALPDGPCLLSDLASFCGLGSGAAKDALDELEALGFVQSMRLARWKVITQTTAGKASEYAVRASEKAALSNLSEAFGDHRGDVIELLAILGEATSKELTMAMRGVHPDKGEPGMGQRVQRLRGEGLLVSDTAEANKQPSHKLSEVGEQVWGYIRPFRSPPSRSVVLEHVRLGLEELHSSSGQPGGEWQPKGRAIAIMRVIDAMGSATQREIVELMEDPFENYRSADLALSGLKERGLIDRSGKGTAHHPYKWAMTEYGRERLRLAQTVKLTD